MGNGFRNGLGFGLALLVCGGAGLLVYKAIGGSSPAPAVASPAAAVPQQPANAAAGDVPAVDKTAITPADAAAYETTVNTLRMIRSQYELYKLQHLDNAPDLKAHANWEFFTRKTDRDGKMAPQAQYGPYMNTAPVNRLNGFSGIGTVDRELEPGDEISGKSIGFVMQNRTCRWWATDKTGRHILDESIRFERPQARTASQGSPAQLSAFVTLNQKREQLERVVITLRSQIELYKLQHEDNIPDFKRYPKWEQLAKPTDAKGNQLAQGGFGPYIQSIPKNPLNGGTSIWLVNADPAAGTKVTQTGAGFIVNARTGRVWGLDENGVVILDE